MVLLPPRIFGITALLDGVEFLMFEFQNTRSEEGKKERAKSFVFSGEARAFILLSLTTFTLSLNPLSKKVFPSYY